MPIFPWEKVDNINKSRCEVNIKIGESKMETEKQMLLKQIAEIEQRLKDDERTSQEQEQRRKDNQKTLVEMKKQLEELNKKEEQPTVSATGVYLDNTMEYLYSLDYDNSILYQLSTNSNIDARIKKLNLNNAFVKEEQAEQELLRREGQEFIRRCAMLWNKDNDWRTNMSGGTEYMYYIGYGFWSKLFVVKTESFVTVGTICFDNQELAEKCIKELKAKYNEEQIKTIFGVK